MQEQTTFFFFLGAQLVAQECIEGGKETRKLLFRPSSSLFFHAPRHLNNKGIRRRPAYKEWGNPLSCKPFRRPAVIY